MIFGGLITDNARFELHDEESEYWLHPNSIGALYLYFFYMNIFALHYARCYGAKICHGLFCIVAIAIIIFTQSRIALLALLVGIFFVLCLSKRRLLTISLVVMLLGAFFYMNGYRDIDELLPRRYRISPAIEDKGAGRGEIWKGYVENMTTSDWLAGRGAFIREESIMYKKPLKMSREGWFRNPKNSWDKIYSTHNTYLEIVVFTGMGGLLLYCVAAIRVFYELLRRVIKKEILWIHIAMWISFLVWHFTDHLFLYYDPLVFWALALSQIFPQRPLARAGHAVN